ncbi:MAG: glycoside hydrolase [Actinobacteria bacterium]|nr:MAG: glycoside hydrolase [Actinomycetota bacterium]
MSHEISTTGPFPSRRRTPLTLLAIVSAAGAVALALVWLIVAVVVPLVSESKCAGVEFRTAVKASPLASRPRIGGASGLAGEVRSALRGDTPAVYCNDFADPYVLRVGDTYYAYSTNTEHRRVPVLTSDGLFGTGRRSEALARLAPWSSPGRVWAPSVLVRPGGFVMYYSTRAPDPDRQCLSRAVGSNPKGPFVDNSAAPLVCPKDGAIDASPFVDADGRAVLIWKHAAPGMTGIVAQQLTPDGLGLVGPRRLLLRADQPWEGGNVEGPSMVAHAGRYYLFYSGNDFATANYAIGYATCETPFGPCRKAPGPWLGSSADAKGPGGQEVFSDSAGRLWLALHAWIRGHVGYPGGARNLFVLPLTFVDGVPVA